MKPTLTTELRAELARAAATLKTVIATARPEGAEYFRLLGQREEIAAKVTAAARNPGQSDPTKISLEWERSIAESEPHAAKERVLAAVEATQTLQAKVFTMAHQEVKADVRRRLADFYTPARLEAVESTELETRIGALRLRLRNPPAQRTFAAVLAWAELTQHVLADLAADKLEFTVQPEEAKAA